MHVLFTFQKVDPNNWDKNYVIILYQNVYFIILLYYFTAFHLLDIL